MSRSFFDLPRSLVILCSTFCSTSVWNPVDYCHGYKSNLFKTLPPSLFPCPNAGEENLLAILKRRWWKYMILGIIDIEANYLVVKAYQYTTFTSVQVRSPIIATLLTFSYASQASFHPVGQPVERSKDVPTRPAMALLRVTIPAPSHIGQKWALHACDVVQEVLTVHTSSMYVKLKAYSHLVCSWRRDWQPHIEIGGGPVAAVMRPSTHSLNTWKGAWGISCRW